MIRISAEPHADLLWDEPIREATERDRIVWKFDLGLEKPYFPLEDELYFQALSSALTHFSKEIWPRFQDKTEGAILYQGSANFSEFFIWSDRQETNWAVWKKDRPEGEEAHLKRLFCAEMFVAYFQMLAHRLPDELPLKLILDPARCGTPAETLHLLSPERFEHFEVEEFEETKAQFGICFPSDALCSKRHLDRIDAILSEWKTPCKAVYEPRLTELWDGLDELYVFSDAVTAQGKRKLMGFCAAGGTVITEGVLLDLPSEVSEEEYRGRGI